MSERADWTAIREAAAALLVSAAASGYSQHQAPSPKDIYDAKKIARAFGFQLVKQPKDKQP